MLNIALRCSCLLYGSLQWGILDLWNKAASGLAPTTKACATWSSGISANHLSLSEGVSTFEPCGWSEALGEAEHYIPQCRGLRRVVARAADVER